jgi:hypothetical protein
MTKKINQSQLREIMTQMLFNISESVSVVDSGDKQALDMEKESGKVVYVDRQKGRALFYKDGTAIATLHDIPSNVSIRSVSDAINTQIGKQELQGLKNADIKTTADLTKIYVS